MQSTPRHDSTRKAYIVATRQPCCPIFGTLPQHVDSISARFVRFLYNSRTRHVVIRRLHGWPLRGLSVILDSVDMSRIRPCLSSHFMYYVPRLPFWTTHVSVFLSRYLLFNINLSGLMILFGFALSDSQVVFFLLTNCTPASCEIVLKHY